MNKGQLSLEQMIFIRNNIDETTTCDYLGRVMGVDAHIIRRFVKEYIVGIATGQTEDTPLTSDGKNAAAVALGRLGGLKGGKARAESLTAKKRSEIAQKAAKARWNKKTENGDSIIIQKELKKRGRPEIKNVVRFDKRRFLFIMNEIGVCFKRFNPDKDDAVDSMVVIKQLHNEHSKSQRPKAEYTQSKSPYGIANELHGIKIR